MSDYIIDDEAFYAASDRNWEQAAEALEADGYIRDEFGWPRHIFRKDGAPTMILVSSFGSPEWRPREFDEVIA